MGVFPLFADDLPYVRDGRAVFLAVVADETGQRSDVPVRVEVIGGPNTGENTFCWSHTTRPNPLACETTVHQFLGYRAFASGTDTVQFHADLNGDGVIDPSEP